MNKKNKSAELQACSARLALPDGLSIISAVQAFLYSASILA